jgi:hypothetical protein
VTHNAAFAASIAARVFFRGEHVGVRLQYRLLAHWLRKMTLWSRVLPCTRNAFDAANLASGEAGHAFECGDS